MISPLRSSRPRGVRAKKQEALVKGGKAKKRAWRKISSIISNFFGGSQNYSSFSSIEDENDE